MLTVSDVPLFSPLIRLHLLFLIIVSFFHQQKLPAVGPKSAFVIQQYRDLHDGIKTIEELKVIPGLAKTFYNKFCVQNQVKEVSEEEEQQ